MGIIKTRYRSEIISAGSCGALEQLDESVFLVPRKALRDEGTSYHYARPRALSKSTKEQESH